MAKVLVVAVEFPDGTDAAACSATLDAVVRALPSLVPEWSSGTAYAAVEERADRVLEVVRNPTRTEG